MSDRANGWLLIFGGLAIGLVLWLSPSPGRSSGKLELIARHRFEGLIRRLAVQSQPA